MQVERFFEQVKDRRVLIELPDTFNGRRVEVKIHGDIFSSVPETDRGKHGESDELSKPHHHRSR
ncbi:MAG: hypothetical protein EA406_06310 [Rhodospirillales bacterium]|nr:MAG: hypothetical protein EA406_06310 [Rhodospirillales bacterium]